MLVVILVFMSLRLPTRKVRSFFVLFFCVYGVEEPRVRLITVTIRDKIAKTKVYCTLPVGPVTDLSALGTPTKQTLAKILKKVTDLSPPSQHRDSLMVNHLGYSFIISTAHRHCLFQTNSNNSLLRCIASNYIAYSFISVFYSL